MKIRVWLIRLLQTNSNLFKLLDYALRTLSIVAFTFWILSIEIPYIANEAAFAGIIIVSTSFNQLYRWLLDEAEFSPSHALVFGYIENFIEPVIIQLLEDQKEPKICIYRPSEFSELSDRQIDREKGELRSNNFELMEVNLDLKHGRARDVLIIQKKKGKQMYFDFPGTLKSLIPYVDYKIDSQRNKSNEGRKKQLGGQLINNFFEKLIILLEAKKISKYISFCDSKLNLPMK